MPDSPKQNKIDHRFKLLNREAALITGLLASGLYHLKRIQYGNHEYYTAFYNLSMGLERMLKLLLLISGSNYEKNHDLKVLFKDTGFVFAEKSIEQKIVTFLSGFAKGDRYTILDDLASGRDSKKEPVQKFYKEVVLPVLDLHPPRKVFVPPADFLADVFSINEDFTETDNFQSKIIKDQLVEHAAKYVAMYSGRILNIVIPKITSFEGINGNPYFSEHFVYLTGDDQYFKTRKTFTSRR